MDLTELRRLANEATPGPWEWGREWGQDYDRIRTVAEKTPVLEMRAYPEGSMWIDVSDADGDYMVAAANALPELLDRLERAEAALAQARAQIEAESDYAYLQRSQLQATEAALAAAQEQAQEAHTALRYVVNALAFIQDEADAKHVPSVGTLAYSLRQKVIDALRAALALEEDTNA